MFCVLLIGVILIGPCLNTFLKDQTYVEPQAAAGVPTNVILEDKQTDENSVNLTSYQAIHVFKGRPRRSPPSKRKKIWKRKCVNKEDCGSNNVSAQPTDSYSEKKQADRHGETTMSSNNLPRHLSKHELRKLWRKIRKCEHKKTTKCKRLLRSAAEETISLNLVNKEHKRKELFNKRYCFDQDSVATYNPEKELCCNGLHERANRSMECCGGEVIDNTQQSCCNDVKHERLETHDCCGMTYYDKHEHTCCQGFLRSTRPDTGCCGSDTYHIRKQICCYNQIIFNVTDRGENSCCTSAAFNNDTSICCGREVYPKIENNDCCGNQLYDVKCYSCDKGTIVPAFNDTAQICCDNKVMDRLYGESTECCDGKLVNGSANSCLIKTTVPDISLEEEQPADRTEYEGKTNLIGLIVVSALLVVVIAVLFVSLFTCRRRCTRRKSVRRDISVNNACQILDDPNIDHGFVDQISSDDSIETDVNVVPKPLCEGDSGLFDLNALDKNTSVPTGNSFRVFFKDTSSQTFPAKPSNCRTIFGKPFDHTYMLGKSSSTIQMPHSDVQMTLPQCAVQDSDVEVHCSTFSALSSMRSKFNLPDDKRIASPVVEYLLTCTGKLKEHALVKMPFCGPITDLTVMKFQSDEGLNSVVESEEVPQQGKENKDLDVCYIVEGWNVLIYTKSFSGFFCTTCSHRPLQLRSFLFGSYKKFIQPLRFEARISLYIADDLMKFADYRNRMFTNEDAEGRLFKGENQLKLPEDLEETDQLEAHFSPMTEHLSHWKHKTYPTSNTPIYAGVQNTQMDQIVTKCNKCPFRCHLPERDIPFRLQWYMINQEGIIPCETFQCMAETKFTHLANNTSECTPMIIDELHLRSEDRYPIEDARFASDIRRIKEYVANLDLAKRNVLMSSLTARVGCTAVSVDDVFDKMQEKFRPQATLQAIVGSMKETQMFKELDLLVAYNFIPSNLTHTAVQVVYNTMPSAGPRRQESMPDVLTVCEVERNTSSVSSRRSNVGDCAHVLSIPTVTLQRHLLSSGEENTRTLNVPTITEQDISPPRDVNDGSVNVPAVQEIQISTEENYALNRPVGDLQEVHMSAEENNTILNRPPGNVPEIPMAAEGDSARSRSVSTLTLQGNQVSHVIENETSPNVPRRLEQESNITSVTRNNSVETVKLHAHGYSCSEADRETRAELSGSLHCSFDANAAADGNKQEENFEESHTTEIRGELPADRSVATSLPEESQK